MIYWRREESCSSSQKGGEKVTTGFESALWTFIALHRELPGTGCSGLILADCKSWWTLLSKLWTDLCRLGLCGLREVMKPAWNTVENEHSLHSSPRMTTALCKFKLACLCWFSNYQRQKNPQVSMQAPERPQIRWRTHAFTALPCLPVCHNQSILWVVTRSWIIDSCRQLTAYVTADSVKHRTAECSDTRWRLIFTLCVFSSTRECWRDNAAICICLVTYRIRIKQVN